MRAETDENAFLHRAVEAAIRIGLVALLVTWCFLIVRPFIVLVVWGIIIAVAIHPLYARLVSLLGGRPLIAASLCSAALLILLLAPTVMLAGTVAEGAQRLASYLDDGSVILPEPPADIATWPVVGEPIDRFWRLASENLRGAAAEVEPQIRALGRWLLTTVAGLGIGLLQFVLAIILAGILLAHTAGGGRTASAIAVRLAGKQGEGYVQIGQATVRSVARGILGVALIQSLLAGLGFLAAGIPGAGFLALICLFLSIIQIGPTIVLIGATIYVFSTADILTSVIFLAWSIFVAVIDNVLKPILLGRGVQIPMIVIFVGAIGGFLLHGIIGLFTGSVVLALSYTVFRAWLSDRASR